MLPPRIRRALRIPIGSRRGVEAETGDATLTILLVAVVATLIPARRATRVDPVAALRAE